MKNFKRIETAGVIHYVAQGRSTHSIGHYAVRIIGIDPSDLTGFAVLRLSDWETEAVSLDYFSVSGSPKSDDAIEKVRFQGEAYKVIVKLMQPTMMAIELPFVGKGYRSKNPLNQGRLFQHLIDLHPALYYEGFSEIHNTQVKAAVLKKGDPRKKPFVVQRVSEEFDLDWGDAATPFKEAVCDAIATAKAFISLSKRHSQGR